MRLIDLMIGDWVYCTYWPQKRIVQVSELKRVADDELKVVIVVEDISLVFDGKYIEPIPLTAEILEKNGFRTFGLIDAPKYGLWLNDGRIIELSRIDNGWRIWVFYNNIPMSLNYLHELQHALRLCGIDKEIDYDQSRRTSIESLHKR